MYQHAILNTCRVLCFLCCAWAGWGNIVWAQLPQGKWRKIPQKSITIELKATTQLTLRVRRDAQGRPSLHGALLDDRKKPIAGASLRLEAPDGSTRFVKTDTKGRYKLLAMGLPPKGNYAAFFNGQGSFSSSSVRRWLDLGRVDLQLSLTWPPPLPAGKKGFEVKAKLSYKDKGLTGYPLTLYLQTPDSLRKTKKGTATPGYLPLMTFHTDDKGELLFLWKGNKPLEGPATLKLLVRYAGGPFFLPQQKNFELAVLAPLPDKQKNQFWSYLLGVAGLGLVLLLGGLLRRYLSRRKQGDEHSDERFEMPALPPVMEAGGRVPHMVAPTDLTFAGRLYDAYEQAPISGGALFLITGDVDDDDDVPDSALTFLVDCDEKGRFSWEFASAGVHRLYFKHPHYKSRVVSIRVPHHGEGRASRVFLYSYRYLIFEMYKTAVMRIAPDESFDPKRQTAREILKLLTGNNHRSLTPLADLFEASYYAPTMPQEVLYTEADTLLRELLRELRRRKQERAPS
ncbi:MAG: hypothetical protein CL920_18730 [Deltaproteobacteria bacterium]|nr:hypothetical protein [Deltaproteobacteria bacterium]MBU50720.1 hypothetical protein [Deltaproteobacteria bacterium]